MEFFKVARKRVSVRAFLPKPVEKSKLHSLLECANLAPSAGNLQSYRMVLVKGKETRRKLARASRNQEFVATAPVLLAFLADRERPLQKYGQRGASLYCVQDATIAAAYAQLAAAALGLGSVWVGGFDEKKVAALLKAKPHESPVVMLPVGYPREETEGHERRKLAGMLSEL